MTRITCLLLGLLISTASAAQNNFRSVQTGDWNQSSTWEEFIAGSFQPTSNTPDNTSGTITIQSTHVVTVTAAVTIDQATVQAGGFLQVAAGIPLTVNNGSGTDLVVAGELNLLGESFIDGAGDIRLNGVMRVGSLNSTGALVTGTTAGNIRNSGVRTYANGSRVIFEGSAAQFIGNGHPGNFTSGVTTEINNSNGVSFDTNCGSNFSGGGTLYLPGNLILTSGDLSIVSAAGVGRTFYSTAGITGNGNFINISGPAVNILLTGNGDLDFPSAPGLQTVGNLTVIKSGDDVTFPSAFNIVTRLTASGDIVFNDTGNVLKDVVLNVGSIDFNGSTTITGSVTLANATTLFFEGQALSMGGNFTTTGGMLSSDATSTLALTGNIAHSSPLTFSPGSALSSLSMNKINAGTSATINSALTLTTALTLSNGILSIVGGDLSLTSGATITRASSSSIATSSPSGGPWNLVYTGTSLATGLEIPASGALTSLAVNINSASAVTLTQDINVSGAFSVNGSGRTFTSGTNNVAVGTFTNSGIFSAPTAAATTGLTVSGNFVNNRTYTHNSGTLVVDGNCTMSGSQITVTNFSAITISATGTLTAPSTLNMSGNFTNNGAFVAGSNLVVFNGGTSTLGGTNIGTTNFNNVTINPGATVVAGTNFILVGNFTVNGTYTAGSGTTTFAGNTLLAGTNINTTQFNHVQINTSSTLTPSNIFLVGGNFINNGTFVQGSKNVTFTGSSTLSGTTINTTTFFDIIINNGATLVAPATFTVQGNFTNNGTYTAGTGTIVFSGNTGGKIISGTTNTQFYALTMNKSNGGSSIAFSSPQTVTNSLNLLDGILTNTGGNLTVSSGATLTRSAIGTIVTASPSGGPWNLVYTGLSQSTGLEIPASGILTSLSINVLITRAVTLTQSITVQNALTISGPGISLISGANNISTATVTNNGTFSAPTNAATTGLTVTGNFVNNATFTHNSGLTTFSGTTTISGSAQTNFGRVTITGTLTAGLNFGVAGNFTNNGTFNAATFAVIFNGTSLQSIAGSTTTFRDITVSNTFSPVGVSVETTVNLLGILTMGANAKLDADGAGGTSVLIVTSTDDSPAVDASIAALPATAQVLGSVTVQRFFSPADNFDRFISSPVSNATIAQIQASTPANSFPVTGGFPGTSFPCAGCNNDGDNLRWYREADIGIISKGYIGWISATTNTLVPGVGYDAYMWNGVFNTTMNMRGTINRGLITLGVVTGPPSNSITHTNNGVPSADGWNLVGNPYPSPIQWSNGAGWTRTNIDPTVWVWDVVGKVWHSYNATTTVGDLTNGIIATGQGFWVYAPAVGAATISVDESVKSIAGTGSYFRKGGDEMMALQISLSNNNATDNSFIVYNTQATKGYDMGIEAPKLQLGFEQLSVSIVDPEKRKMAHYAVGRDMEDELPISVFGESEGEYSLRFEVVNNFPGVESLYLVDSYMGRSMAIASGKPYAFTISADPASSDGRFYLSRNPMLEAKAEIVRLSYYPNPAVNTLTIEINSPNVSRVSLLDNSGRLVYDAAPAPSDSGTSLQMDVSERPNGLYILRVVADGNLLIRKVLIRH